MSTLERDLLRQMTLGAPARQMRKKLVPIRDASKPRALEVVLDEEGQPKREPVLDTEKNPVLGDDGQPLTQEVKKYRHPPMLKADGTPVMVEVREPSIKLRASIFKAAGVTGADGEKIDMAELQVETVVALTYVPDTNIKVYTDADKQALRQQLVGGFADDIFEFAYPLMNVSAEEEAKKN
jgi:hypothetical protein